MACLLNVLACFQAQGWGLPGKASAIHPGLVGEDPVAVDPQEELLLAINVYG